MWIATSSASTWRISTEGEAEKAQPRRARHRRVMADSLSLRVHWYPLKHIANKDFVR
jgi:hypothetical protein